MVEEGETNNVQCEGFYRAFIQRSRFTVFFNVHDIIYAICIFFRENVQLLLYGYPV